LVKSYAVDFCGTKELREATREQVENFVTHLAEWAEKEETPYFASSTAISAARKVPHDAPLPRTQSDCPGSSNRRTPGWDLPGKGRQSPLPLARAQAGLPSPAFGSRTARIRRPSRPWPTVLHGKSFVEIGLVSARLWL
jgi:hypothetical protein